jgi:hypothetical protein
MKFTQDGNLVWQKTYQRGYISAIVDNGQGFFLGGNFDSPGSSSNSVLYKVNSNGVVEWMIEYDIYSKSSINTILDFGNSLFLV